MKRKLLASLVTLMMVLCMFPAAVFAETSHDIHDGDVTFGAGDCTGGCEGHVVTGTVDSIWNQHQIAISGGTHKIILDNTTIREPGVGKSAIAISGNANVTIELRGSNAVTGASNHPAIWVEEGSSLTIEGTGSLVADAGDALPGMGAAGIGSGYGTNTTFGNITINGGDITANGTGGGAGIGGGYEVGGGTATGNITINGGWVKAYGGESVLGVTGGAGLGSGENANYSGTITINGGVVFAAGGANSMSIGGGGRDIGQSGNGTFTTGTDGNAVIIAPKGIGDFSQYESWDGIFVNWDQQFSEGNVNAATMANGAVTLNDANANFQVWGEPKVDYPLTVASGSTLRIVNNTRNNAGATLDMVAGGTLTNNGTIMLDGREGNSSYLILREGRSQTAGNGTLSSGTYCAVKLPLSEDLVTLNGAEGLSYTGEAHEPYVRVALDELWGYTQGFSAGADYDYTVAYKNNVNAGTATVEVTSTGTGLLLGTDTVSMEFNIAVADFSIDVPKELEIAEGEDALLSKLPEPVSFEVDNSIQDDLAGVKDGTLTWYLDETRNTPVTDDSLKDVAAGESVQLYWTYTHEDTNFVTSKTGVTTVKVTAAEDVDPVEPVNPGDGDNDQNGTDTEQGEETDAPKTGDETPMALWISLFAVSLAGILLLVGLRRKHHRN